MNVTSATTSAVSMVTKHSRKATNEENAKQDALKKVRVKEAVVNKIEELIKGLEADCANADDATEKESIKESIAARKRDKSNAEAELMIAEADAESYL